MRSFSTDQITDSTGIAIADFSGLEASVHRCAAALRESMVRREMLSVAECLRTGRDRDGTALDLPDLIRATQEAAAAFARNGLDQPGHIIARIGEALALVEQDGASVDGVVQVAPRALCEAGEFDAVVVSQVSGSSWTPQASFSAIPLGKGQSADIATPEARQLVSGGPEAEAVRRRIPSVVQLPAADGAAWSYVVAPVVVGEVVVGLIHAEVRAERRAIGELDRVAVRSFADGLGVIVERLVLQRRLASQGRQLSQALAEAARSINEIGSRGDWVFAPSTPVKRAVRSDLLANDGLTERERDVLRLLVSGATNGQIADRLTVSETTVKSHVRHILHKLRVSNRAEAIAKYLAGRAGTEVR